MALTQGGPSGKPRQIEIHAHDPHRYVGDMSAWIHQCLASESELIISLLRKCVNETEEQKRKYEENKAKILNRCLTDICPPFRARLVQVLSSKPGLVITFRLSNLLDFHRRNFLRLLGPGSTLALTFTECKEDTLKFFFGLAKKHMEKLERAPPIPPSDLSPPYEILEAIQRMSEIMAIIDTSLVPQEEYYTELDAVVESILMPLVDICIQSTPSLQGLPKCVYMLNCISTMKVIIQDSAFATRQSIVLGAHTEKVQSDLIKLQSTVILETCGLNPILTLFKTVLLDQDKKIPLSQIPGLDYTSLYNALRIFDTKLLDLTISMPLTDKLQSQDIRKQVRSAVAGIISDSYKNLYEAVNLTENGYVNVENLFRYKPDQVRTMIEP